MQPDVGRFLPELQTQRLVLRPLRFSDAAAIYAYAQDPEVARHTLWEAHTTVRDSQVFLDFVSEEYRAGRMFVWGITRRGADRVIGTLGLANYVAQHARAELGFALAREHWNQGITTEAVAAVLRVAFLQLNLNRVEAYCKVANGASARVMEKSGMTFEGVLRQRDCIKGKFEDLRLYALLREDYGKL